MQPASERFLSALRAPHTADTRVEAWRGGSRVGGTLLPISGQVEIGVSGNTLRRTLNLELAPERGLWDALAPAGTTVKAWRGVRFVDGTVERIPLGVFDIEEQNLGYGPSGGMTLTAADVWVRVQRARFETPRTTNGSALTAAVDFATEAIGLGTGALNATSTATTRRAVWPRDREEAIGKLAEAAAAWVHTDPTGKISTRNVPSLSQPPVWMVDASLTGVMVDASRNRSRQRTYNVVVVSPGELDGTVPFGPVVAEDTDAASPTYVGGPFGRVPYFYTSQLLTTSAQALAAGQAILRRVTGLNAQLDLTAIVNPALEPGDVIEVLLPPRTGDAPQVERHLIDNLTVPLTTDITQHISTRSTRPEGDVPEETG